MFTLFGRVAKAKSLGDLLEQERRLYSLLRETTNAAIHRADSRIVDYHCHYAHNWGNAAAKQELERDYTRLSKIRGAMRRHIAAAKRH
ncbi:hypothetical protein [Hymenobacter mucosus]|uniref:Uncharacterized protein n=1 Tax=Hymenobacter mucosus TaxID=1411120 RepID=A0A239A904_9BACT|nr:hypothetical protein [Hymenobacter mucosus]SNR91544.1 hypothetical protein SAMN06269173_11138 [Hymenobacter mucosus]